MQNNSFYNANPQQTNQNVPSITVDIRTVVYTISLINNRSSYVLLITTNTNTNTTTNNHALPQTTIIIQGY